LRGFRNKQKDENPEVFNIGILVTKFASHVKNGVALTINRKLLQTAKLIGKDYKGIVKVLGTGTVSFPVNIEGFQVSASAKAKIEKAGGTVS
jgi:large subunit ribosomal protein L15